MYTNTNTHTGVKKTLKWLPDWLAGTANALGRTDLNILMPDSCYADTHTHMRKYADTQMLYAALPVQIIVLREPSYTHTHVVATTHVWA